MDIWGLFTQGLPFLLLAIGFLVWVASAVWVAAASDKEYRERPESKNYD
ncbi:hypothetical protein SESI111939_10015 [Serratia silvae]